MTKQRGMILLWRYALGLGLVLFALLALGNTPLTSADTPFTVTNINDAGAGSLRQAILAANANPGPDTIVFDIPAEDPQNPVPQTIDLVGGWPEIAEPLTIDGAMQAGTLCGDNASQLMIRIIAADIPPAYFMQETGDLTFSGVVLQDRFTHQRVRFECSAAYATVFTPPLSVAIPADPDFETGFPVESDTGSSAYQPSGAVAGNIDADAELEIVFGIGGNGGLWVVNHDGSSVAGWPNNLSFRWGSPRMGDLLAASPGLEIASTAGLEEMVAYNDDGTVMPGFPIFMNFVRGLPTLADVNYDGLDEIFINNQARQLTGFSQDGTVVPGFPTAPWNSGQGAPSPAIADLDGNGDYELSTVSECVYSATVWNHLVIANHDGSWFRDAPYEMACIGGSLVVGDVDGDNAPDLIVGSGTIYVLNLDGTIKRSFGSGYGGFSVIALADFSGDSIPEIVAYSETTLGVWYGDGTPLPGWPVALNGSYWTEGTSIAVGDIDGDGQLEIGITVSQAGSSSQGYLLIYNHDGTAHAKSPKSYGTSDVTAPVFADIDLDGRNEVLVTNHFNPVGDALLVYDFGGSNHGRVEWGMYGNTTQGQKRYIPAGVDLQPPTNLVATPVADFDVSLTWTDNATGEIGFILHRSTDAGATWEDIIIDGPNLTSYTDQNLLCSQTYVYRLQSAHRGAGDFSNFSNTAEFTTTPCPGAPTNLVAVAQSQTQIDLTWDDNSDDEDAFHIERSLNGSTGWTEIGTVATNETAYSDITATCGTAFSYRVRAYHSADDLFSAYTNVASATTDPCPPPEVPTNLMATTQSNTAIDLSWTDNSSSETAFHIERSPDGISGWTEIDTVAADVTSYSDTSLTCETAYSYRVRAYRAGDGQYSAYSNVASASTDLCPPTAPTDLVADVQGQTWIDLSWTDNSGDETAFHIERSPDGTSGWTEIDTIGTDEIAYSDTSLTCGTAYSYRVRAYRDTDGQYSAYSNVASATTDACPPPAAPTDVIAVTQSYYQIDLSWTDNSADETAFHIERSLDSASGWAEVYTVAADVTTLNDAPLMCDTTLYYRVRAYRAGDGQYSAYSDVASATTDPCPPPEAPSALSATGLSDTIMHLSWTDNSYETEFRIEQSPDGVNDWTEIDTVWADETEYLDTALTCETEYSYRVRAYRDTDGLYSTYSNVASGTTGTCLTPTTIVVTNTNDSGTGSLRQAILDANANAGYDTIEFDIPGTGPHTIQELTKFPEITDGVIVDGCSQPGADCSQWPPTLQIELDGRLTGIPIAALQIEADNTVVRGLVFNNHGAGVYLLNASHCWVHTNYFGTNVSGTASPNVTGWEMGLFIEGLSQYNVIGTNGDGVNDHLERNLIAGNPLGGMMFGTFSPTTDRPQYNVVAGNLIGTDITGLNSLANDIGVTINIASDNLIGTNGDGVSDDLERNIISGNTRMGVAFDTVQGMDNVVAGNYIGVGLDGTTPVGNGSHGVMIAMNAHNNLIGGDTPAEANVIAYNGQAGIAVGPSAAESNNRFQQNRIFANAALGIDLTLVLEDASGWVGDGVTANDAQDADTGPNGLQNFPVLTGISPTSVFGTLNSTPSTTFTLEFFSSATCDSSGYGQGEQFEATTSATTVTTDASGDAAFSFDFATAVAAERFITATATDPAGNTSEFAACQTVPAWADLGIEKEVDETFPYIGDTVTYTLTITNYGPDIATNMTVRDQLPAGAVYQSHTGGTYDPATGAWTISGLAVDASETLILTAVIDTEPIDTVITNTATIEALGQTDENDLNDTASAALTVSAVDLKTSVTITPHILYEGDDVQFYVDITNFGPSAATGIVVQSPVPSAVTLDDHLATHGTFTPSTGEWVIPSLAPGAQARLTLNAVVNSGTAGASVTFTAENTAADQHDVDLSDNLDSSVVGIDITPVQQPTGLTALAQGTTQIELNWQDNSDDETAFHIERSPDGTSGWTEIDTVGADVTTYLDATLTCGTPYSYRVRAYRDTGGLYSTYSNVATATTSDCSTIVTNTNDAGPGSLRQAILNANAHSGQDTITFAIPGTGPHTITPLTLLPEMIDPVIIDGTTQPSASCDAWPPTLMIEIDGSASAKDQPVLQLDAGDSLIRGLVINNYQGNGIVLNSSYNAVECNFIGTDTTGMSDAVPTPTAAMPRGIFIAGGAQFNRIGTNGDNVADVTERNLISGNFYGIYAYGPASDNTVIAGNFIGTNVLGTASLNDQRGILIWRSSYTRIGTNADGVADDVERNLISGNVDGPSSGGIQLSHTTDSVVAGNYIGTDYTGLAAVGNSIGIRTYFAENARIGTNADGIHDEAERNVIAGNSRYGIQVSEGSTGVVIAGNFIGVDTTGIGPLPNGDGIVLSGGDYALATIENILIGGPTASSANVIAHNAGTGIIIGDEFSHHGPFDFQAQIQGNRIFANVKLGIDINHTGGYLSDGVTPNDPQDTDTGSNDLQNYPVLSTATTTVVTGTLNSTPNTAFTLEFFSNATCDSSGYGEGERFNAMTAPTTIMTDGSGNAAFSFDFVMAVAPGQFITATATDPNGNTSEFSACVPVTSDVTLPADTNLIRNGDFPTDTSEWIIWGSTTPVVTSGVLNLTNTSVGGMFQDMGYPAPPDAPFELMVDLGNTSAAAKNVQVMVHDGAFTDVLFCAFTVPASQALDTFTVRGKTTVPWPDIRVEVSPQTFDGLPALQVDNVNLQYQPGLAVSGTECVAAPSALPENTNLVQNGDFPTDTSEWIVWGSTTPTVSSGVLNLTNTSYGGMFQDMGYSAPTDAPFELTVELGNTSAAAKNVQVMVHDGAFTDVVFCPFTLQAGQALDTFTVRGQTVMSWPDIRVEIIPQTFDGQPALQIDNVNLQYQPGLAVSGTECVAAASALPENTNLVQNGDFPTDTANWIVWGSTAPTVSSGVLNLTNTSYGGMFQDIGSPAPAAAPFELTVDLGNTSAAAKNVQVMVHDGAFTDVLYCAFPVPAGQALDTFTVRGKTVMPWSNIRVEVAPQTFDGLPALQIDNVNLQYQPGLSVGGTECVAAVSALPENTNLIRNGDFPTNTTNWIVWGGTTPTISSGILSLTNTSFGGIFQDMGYPVPPDAPFELTVELGNTSTAAKDVQVMVHDGAFNDVLFCPFTIPAGQTLDTFTVRGKMVMPWANIRVEISPQTFDGLPALQIDNVNLQYQPGLLVSSTECVAAAPPSVPAAEPTPTDLITFEAESALVTASASWTSYASAFASAGTYIYSSGSAADTLSFAFGGTQLDVVYIQHPALGSFDVFVDGIIVAKIASTGPQAFDQRVRITGLPDGAHQAMIVPAEGATVALDAFAVEALVDVLPPNVTPEPTAEPTIKPTTEPTTEPIAEPTAQPTDAPLDPTATSVGPTLQMVESDAAGVQRSGTWATYLAAEASGGSYLYTSGSASDTLSLTISGTRFDVVYITHPALGAFNILVDGVVAAQIDSSGKQAFGRRASITGLAAGEHVVQIVPLAGATIAIDAFAVEALVINEPTLTPVPTVEPTIEPTNEPTLAPTATSLPTVTPIPPTETPLPTATPQPEPTASPEPPPPPVQPGYGG